MTTIQKSGHSQRGFGLVEVLVTLVILLVGLLGLAGMMVQSQRAEIESYQRVQAILLLQDMVGRINANRQVASCYAITTDTSGGAPYVGNDYDATATPPTCSAGTTEQQNTAIRDISDWSALLQGASESFGTSRVGAMLGARGCVSYDATVQVYRVSVAWQGMGASAHPPDSINCAKNKYGTESHRRVVTVTVQLASLSS